MLRRVLAPFRGPYLYGLIVLAGLLVFGIYQMGGSYRWDMGVEATSVYLVDFFGVEHAGDTAFRWTAPRAGLHVPGVGSFAGQVHLRLNGDPWGGPARVVTVQVNDGPPVPLTLDPGWHDYTVSFGRGAAWPGDLIIRMNEPELQIPPAQRDPKDTRHLGVPIQWISVERTGNLVVPPLAILASTLVGIGLLYALAVWMCVPVRVAAPAAAGVLVAWAITLNAARLQVALAAPGLFTALITAVVLALLLRLVLGALFRWGGVVVQPGEWAWLVALFVLALVFKAAGLLDPVFVTLDHYARLHRLMEFGADPVFFLQHFLDPARGETYAGQLGLSAVVPYSPLFYVVFDPLNWLVPDPDTRLRALNLTCSALEASNVFFLFYTLKRAWGDGLAGLWAGAIFIALPLGNLLFSDGGYPGIFATWLLVVLTAALAWAYPRLWGTEAALGRAGRLGTYAVLAVLTALALLAHTANALLLGTMLVIFAVLVALVDRARVGAVLGWAGAGAVLAFLSFYQFSAASVFSDLLPQILAKLQAGGGVGKSTTKLGAPLLSGFWPQIQAHFQTWPVLLGGLWIADRGLRNIQGKEVIRNPQSGAPSRPRNFLLLWLGAWTATFLLFSVIDIWVNLLQKHMIFFMPALALLDGLALAAIWRQGRAGRWLGVALWTALFLASLTIWVARVVNYVLPPGSG